MKSQRVHNIFHKIMRNLRVKAAVITTPNVDITMLPLSEYDSGDEDYYTPPVTPGYTITFQFPGDKNMYVNIPIKEPYITVAELKTMVRHRFPPSDADAVELTYCGIHIKDHVQLRPRDHLMEHTPGLYHVNEGDVFKVVCLKRKKGAI